MRAVLANGLSSVDFGLPHAPVLIALLWAILFPTLLLLAAQMQDPEGVPEHV